MELYLHSPNSSLVWCLVKYRDYLTLTFATRQFRILHPPVFSLKTYRLKYTENNLTCSFYDGQFLPLSEGHKFRTFENKVLRRRINERMKTVTQ